MLVHLLTLAFGSLWYQALLSLSTATTAAARVAITPATLKTTAIRTDGSRACINQTLPSRCALLYLGTVSLVATSIPNVVATTIQCTHADSAGSPKAA